MQYVSENFDLKRMDFFFFLSFIFNLARICVSIESFYAI